MAAAPIRSDHSGRRDRLASATSMAAKITRKINVARPVAVSGKTAARTAYPIHARTKPARKPTILSV